MEINSLKLIKDNELLDLIYPVGSIYMSVKNSNPQTLFGGEWEQLKDRFLLGTGDTYSNGATGGAATHKLTINEMPKHTHQVRCIGLTAQDGNVVSVPSIAEPTYQAPTGETGGDKAHNNMPPYLTVYMWKRTK